MDERLLINLQLVTTLQNMHALEKDPVKKTRIEAAGDDLMLVLMPKVEKYIRGVVENGE